jgi:N-acetylglucosamine malate deacetylase 1
MKKKWTILAIGAHPDDIEAGASGMLIKAVKAGWRTYCLDLTRGEMNDFGDGSVRIVESKKSAKILGATKRINLGLRDGNIEVNLENKNKLIKAIRKYKPYILLLPYWNDRHPDHKNASELGYQSYYSAKYSKIKTGSDSWKVNLVLYYQINDDFKSNFVLDITDVFQKKLSALKTNRSQYYKAGNEIDPFFFEYFTAKFRYFGEKVGVRYGEPYITKAPLSLKNMELLIDLNNAN